MSDLQEFEKTRKLRAASFMMKQHRQACEEQGDDPEEVDTFYSLAADALSRALPAVQTAHVNETPKSEHVPGVMLTPEPWNPATSPSMTDLMVDPDQMREDREERAMLAREDDQ